MVGGDGGQLRVDDANWLRRCDLAFAGDRRVRAGQCVTRVVRCFMRQKDLHHRGATGNIGLLSHLKRPHGIAILAIIVFGLGWLIWTFVVL